VQSDNEQCRGRVFSALEFIRAEALGTDTPARCIACRSCKECQFRAASISFKENKEYKVILNRQQLDPETALYPFHVFPWTRINSYRQPRKYMEMQERRLINWGRLEEFNSQFYGTVERGVFWKLSPKGGRLIPGSSLRHNGGGLEKQICMNSSMKQPPPSGKSLNDYLIQGLSALVDLFTVTLKQQKYQCTLTKVLSLVKVLPGSAG
jgi:hypothetical protein